MRGCTRSGEQSGSLSRRAGIQLPLAVEAAPAPSLYLQPFTLGGEDWGSPAAEPSETGMLERQEAAVQKPSARVAAPCRFISIYPRSSSCTLYAVLWPFGKPRETRWRAVQTRLEHRSANALQRPPRQRERPASGSLTLSTRDSTAPKFGK